MTRHAHVFKDVCVSINVLMPRGFPVHLKKRFIREVGIRMRRCVFVWTITDTYVLKRREKQSTEYRQLIVLLMLTLK